MIVNRLYPEDEDLKLSLLQKRSEIIKQDIKDKLCLNQQKGQKQPLCNI